jgi:mono/diheme cytochrome c family protein
MLTNTLAAFLALPLPALVSAPSAGDAPAAPAAPVYARDVAPIVQRRCQGCHRPGQVGPFALTSFDEVRGHAKMIASVLEQGAMPPWNADARFDGVFVNQRSLTAAEKKTLVDWIAGGMPRGNPADEPAPKKWPEGWSIGTPDVVFTPDFDLLAQKPLPKEGYAVPREGVVEYQYFTVETHFPEDRWLQALEAKPGAHDVVHHVLTALKGAGTSLDEKGFLATYVPGDTPSIYPEGYAKRLPKGATILFQVHYTPNGKERFDRPELALVFAKEPPEFVVESQTIMNRSFEIPPGAAQHEVRAEMLLSRDVGLMSLMPHMHTRGKDFQILAHLPDGESRELLFSHYDFNWQESYILPDPMLLPAGTKLECIGHFDNSKANPNNPDAGSAVHWGDQTFEEMFVGFLDTVVPLE